MVVTHSAEWVKAAHASGIELRVVQSLSSAPCQREITTGSATCCQYPSADREVYGDMLWMDPGEEQAAAARLR